MDFIIQNFHEFLTYTGFANATAGNLIMILVGARHMPFAEQNDEYCKVLEEWMEEKEGK